MCVLSRTSKNFHGYRDRAVRRPRDQLVVIVWWNRHVKRDFGVIYEAIFEALHHLALVCTRVKQLFYQMRYFSSPAGCDEAKVDCVHVTHPMRFKLGEPSDTTEKCSSMRISALTQLPLARYIETLQWVEVCLDALSHDDARVVAQSFPNLKEIRLHFGSRLCRDLRAYHLDIAKDLWSHVPKVKLHLILISKEFLYESGYLRALRSWEGLYLFDVGFVTCVEEMENEYDDLRNLFNSVPSNIKLFKLTLLWTASTEQKRSIGEKMESDLSLRFPQSTIMWSKDAFPLMCGNMHIAMCRVD